MAGNRREANVGLAYDPPHLWCYAKGMSNVACGAVIFANGGPNVGPFVVATVATVEVTKEGHRSASVDALDELQSFFGSVVKLIWKSGLLGSRPVQVNQ